MARPDHAAIRARAEAAGQGQLFNRLEELDATSRDQLFAELESLDWDLLDRLRASLASETCAEPVRLEPVPSIRKGADSEADDRARERGEQLLREGRVAVFVVAGGQGSRLGFEGPKGQYPATAITKKSLFQLFAEKIRAVGDRAGEALPWYVMTSRGNHAQTLSFFDDHACFGLDPADVRFFSQDMLPAMDEQGSILLEAPGRVFLSPNGHGGSLLALNTSGALDDMARRGVEQIFYFQVDNPLAVMADPVFLGYHDLEGAQMSTKVVDKTDPDEKVGLVGLVNGRFGVIEYSDLSAEERAERSADGQLRFRAGNIAIHALRRDFVEEITRGGLDLPFHLARKAIPCVDPECGDIRRVPGVKFETFVFDALAHCERSIVLSVDRAEEFAPIKNAEGSDSPATSLAAQSALFATWLEEAGVGVEREEGGRARFAIEIAPRFADSARALRDRGPRDIVVNSDLYLE